MNMEKDSQIVKLSPALAVSHMLQYLSNPHA